MRTFWTASALALSLCAAAAAQNGNTLKMDKPLAQGGMVSLTMNVGDLKVLPSDGAQVRLEIQSERADDKTMQHWVRQFNVAANRAEIDIHMPKNHEHCADCYGNTSVTLYVPRRCDLKVELGVGDLTVSGVEGNKQIHDGIGDLRVGIAGRNEYGHIETHTRIGDIDDPFNPGGQNGFLGKTEDFNLHGQYNLKARVGIGDIHMVQEGKR